MEKMTTDELAKALEMCTPNEVCATCSLPGGGSCAAVIRKNALDLTKRLRADLKQKDTEIDILIRKNETLKDEVAEQKAEIERLQNERIERIRELTRVVYDKEIAEIKSEARKEFAERLKCGVPQETGVIRCKDVDFTLTELTGQ